MAELSFSETEVKAITKRAADRGRAQGVACGVLGAVAFLVLMGQTGGSSLRGMLQEQREAHAEYREQCEASLVRAVAALDRAETILEAR